MSLRSSPVRRAAAYVGGIVCIVIGLAGLVLPVIPGLVFLVIGMGLLSAVSARARLGRQRLGRRFPILRRGMVEAKAWMARRGWAR